jgi:hypothetical protein
MPSPSPSKRRDRRSPRLMAAAMFVLALAVGVGATACDSSGHKGPGPTAPSSSATSGASTTTRPPRTTTSKATTTTGEVTTTSEATTTTSSNDPPTSTTTSEATTTTSEVTTTTEARTTTTQGRASTSTSTSEATTTVVPATVPDSEKKAPWLAVGLVAALLALLGLVALRRHSGQVRWWSRVDSLGRDGQALVDLGRAGPAATDPSQQVAHWSALEQRAQALGMATAAVRADAPDSQSRVALDGLGRSSDQYLSSIRNARALRIGPPAPTTEQLAFADAEAGQRLAVVADQLNQLSQLAAPHRQAPAS